MRRSITRPPGSDSQGRELWRDYDARAKNVWCGQIKEAKQKLHEELLPREDVESGEVVNKPPLVSIVTVVYNGKQTIDETIRSVMSQTYRDIEYIIVDGGSSDSTVDILKRYEHDIAYWVSLEDGGIYDAMNFGLSLASGEIVGLLNADDLLLPDAIEKVAISFMDSSVDFVYGDAHIVTVDGDLMCTKIAEKNLLASLPYRMPFAHQTMYVRRSTLNRVGPYDTTYRLSADLDFVCRMVYAGFKGVHISGPVSCFRVGGLSGGIQTFSETRRIAVIHGMSVFRSWGCFISSIVKMTLAHWLPPGWVSFIRRIKGSRYVKKDA